MIVFSRINQRLMAWKRGGMTLAVKGDEIIVDGAGFALTDATEIVAYQADIFVGHLLCLAVGFASGKLVNVNQEDACWHDLVAALDRLGLTEMRSEIWVLELIGNSGQKTMKLRGRG